MPSASVSVHQMQYFDVYNLHYDCLELNCLFTMHVLCVPLHAELLMVMTTDY